MSNRDGTGPYGQGPTTGKGMGSCTAGNNIGFRSRGGFGRNRGRGYFCKRFDQEYEPITLTKEEERNILESNLKAIQEEQKGIEKRLKELKK